MRKASLLLKKILILGRGRLPRKLLLEYVGVLRVLELFGGLLLIGVEMALRDLSHAREHCKDQARQGARAGPPR
jgi:hypothetical protein